MALSTYANPTIDSIAASRIMAPVVMKNIVNSIQLHDGRGVTEEFSDDVYAGQIRVIRIKPLTQKLRKLLETTDGLHFSAQTAEQPTTEAYGIDMLHQLDTPLDVPQSAMDKIRLDLLNGTVKVLYQKVAKVTNAITLAEQLSKSLNKHYNSGGTAVTTHIVTATLGTDDLLDKFFDMSTVLDNGDSDNGVDAFPLDSRAIQLRPSVVNYFRQSGKAVFDLGNWKGQEMLKVGAFDYETIPNVDMNGYLGQVNQTEFYVTPNAIWTLAEAYLGLTAGDLDNVYGILSAAEGTGRALAFQREMVMGQSPKGQGVRIYPLYTMGVETWFENSIVLLCATGFTTPLSAEVEAIGDGSRA